MTKNNTETLVLDYVLVCEELFQYFNKMVIDEARQFTLTKYATTKGIAKKIGGDYNPIFCDFNIIYDKAKVGLNRREIFNLKNPECQVMGYSSKNASLE